jgi:hypothetical protein
VIEASARVGDSPSLARWLAPLMALGGAALFLYGPPYLVWIWSGVLLASVLVPTFLAAVRILRGDRRPQMAVGVALAGGICGTLLFVQKIGIIVGSGLAGPPGLPPVFSPGIGLYVGVAAGGLMVAGAILCALSLRLSSAPPPGDTRSRSSRSRP